MKLLLDTHTFLWFINGSPQLSADAKNLLESEVDLLLNRDPFDRLLVAQAIVEKVSIVSVDVVFDSYTVNRIW
ncbi:MAG TPA: hypothetical protein DDZ80_07370 [Cyanobacteria bacterium UBA8803]|nr:hypothetical protein [Cyanobacteria bacterium UBA9273]HBL58334.1 hypothetical protein [Cyanobacteria bacterium UBA8803]